MGSNHIMWSVTSVAVEKLLERASLGYFKVGKFPGGSDYNKQVVEPNYQKFGW